MTDLRVNLAGVELKNPIVVPSGTFGFGREYGQFFDLSELGAICVKGLTPLRREGHREGTWVLLDYGSVAVHVFSQEAREFYDLERLWRDGKSVDLTGVITDGD